MTNGNCPLLTVWATNMFMAVDMVIPIDLKVSSNGNKWYEVARDIMKRNSYSWDFQNKDVKAKFIRIGREPEHRKNDAFSLNKILIYGKK